jgi:LacI family transcriptional regulator
MAVTMRDVAQLAGVSPMSVSRVLSGSPRVAPEMRRRVETAVAELGYVPNGLARGLSCRRTRTLAVVVPDIANPFFTLLVQAAEEEAWLAGYQVFLCNTQGDTVRERRHLEDMVASCVEGVLIAAAGDSSAANLGLLDRNGVPYVLVDRSVGGAHADLVEGDNVEGARRLVEHVIGLGHRRIGYVTESGDVSTARDRLRGYRLALEAAGIAFDASLVVETSVIERRPRPALGAMAGLLALPDPPTAIFAVNNMAAVGVAEAARERGVRIPEDVGLVCFDDIEQAAQLDPFLTVMAQPAGAFGSIAARLLLDRIAGRGGERPCRVVLPGELVVRRSAAPVSIS